MGHRCSNAWDEFARWWGTLNWGDVPAWVGLVLAGVAAAIALVTYRQSVTVRAEAQARLVYATRSETAFIPTGELWATGDTMGSTFPGMVTLFNGPPRLAHPGVNVRVEVHNGSDEPLPQASVQIHDYGLKKPASAWARFGVVPPRSSQAQWVLFPDEHGSPMRQGAYNVYLAFRDSSGRWWEREEGDIIRALKGDPTPD